MIQLTNAVERYNRLILSELKQANITCWIAGGALRDYFAGVKIKSDYDLFFPNEENFLLAKIYFETNGGTIKWESENGVKIYFNNRTYDLVKKYFPSPKETIEAFDFTVSMFAVDTENVYHGESSFIDLAKRQLMINKITFPASTLSRAFRYTKKGYGICLGEMKKIIESIQDMPKEKPEEMNIEPQTSGDALAGFFVGID